MRFLSQRLRSAGGEADGSCRSAWDRRAHLQNFSQKQVDIEEKRKGFIGGDVSMNASGYPIKQIRKILAQLLSS